MWAERAWYGQALRTRTVLHLVASDGARVPLDVGRWLDVADDADASVLDRCTGAVLDVGCGPGRMVHACRARGLAALGVDVAPDAVEMSNSRGAPALLGNVFGALPDEGRWGSVLLLDGNIGIGGDVERLLTRAARLIAPGGQIMVEVAPDCSTERRLSVRLHGGGEYPSRPFAWSVVGASGVVDRAGPAGLAVVETWQSGGRHFVRLAAA